MSAPVCSAGMEDLGCRISQKTKSLALGRARTANRNPLREVLSTSADANGGLPMVEITKTQTVTIRLMMTMMMILAILMTTVVMLLTVQARIPLPNGSV